ncbi:ThiF family protein [Leptospira fainei serovar Hurstbridge str. BUT 6]|uniref:ThiF family protein n=1 Tax=Leptospira fainei serovar Hurstbridge str. BUT 6 TaxID=1193011 RepID=S3UZZ7_9LEPT|nr:HesA/MoeB/ThiF family protein [Leptospira fainei]EPG75986.1 ThiF family protein [Leptospira fainei serovar Hurstbridge str. BUT 6]
MNSDQRKFFSRQIRVPAIGEAGQLKLLKSSVLLVGLGGLGSPAALHLATAGIGRLGLMDFDRIELTNLHRQTAFTLFDIGRLKTEVTSEFLKARVPDLVTELFSNSFSRTIAPEFLNDWDLVIDCTDTSPAKYAINDLCFRAKKPLITASVYRTSAQFSLFSPNGKPCYRCLYPRLDENETLSCTDAGVLGIQTALAGLQQASLAVRYLLDPNSVSYDSLFLLEWESPVIYESKIKTDPNCTTCGSIGESGFQTDFIKELSPEDYLNRRETHAIILMDVREEEEQNTTPIQGAIRLPLSRIASGEKPAIASETPLVLICESGVRSAKAVELLREMFPDIYSLSGGRRSLQALLAGKRP